MPLSKVDLLAARRQLKIKSGVVKRLSKEHGLYKLEARQQQQKLDEFVAAGAEGWDINNATRMMEEANKMIVDAANRLGKATGELKDLITASKKEPQLAEDQELLDAEKTLEEASAV